MQRMTTAEATIESLVRHGIDTLYAVPGVHNDHLFDAAHRASDRFRVIYARHEQTAAYMALGAAMVRGKPQVYAVVPGPGLLNASAALPTAYAVGAPVLALVGQIAQSRSAAARPSARDPRPARIMRSLTKYADRIHAPHEAPLKVTEAFRQMRSGRAAAGGAGMRDRHLGPIWAGRIPPIEPPLVPPVDMAAVERAAGILGKAERPLAVVGGGAIDAAPEVQRVAEMIEGSVASFRRGRGVLPTTHQLAISFTEGHRLWQDADAVLAIGTRVYWQESNWGWRRACPWFGSTSIPTSRPASARPLPPWSGMPPRFCERSSPSYRNTIVPGLPPISAPFAPGLPNGSAGWSRQLSFLRSIRAALPDDGIFVEDVTQLGFVSRLALPITRPRTFLSPGYQDNLGWAYGAALGAQAALPGRKVLAIAGNGGFLYQASELATAVRHRLPVVVVVFDDGAFGNVRRIQAERSGNRLIGCDLANPDFVAFARSFGAAAFRADTPPALEQALHEAFALNSPALVHVKVGEMQSPGT